MRAWVNQNPNWIVSNVEHFPYIGFGTWTVESLNWALCGCLFKKFKALSMDRIGKITKPSQRFHTRMVADILCYELWANSSKARLAKPGLTKFSVNFLANKTPVFWLRNSRASLDSKTHRLFEQKLSLIRRNLGFHEQARPQIDILPWKQAKRIKIKHFLLSCACVTCENQALQFKTKFKRNVGLV